MCLSAIESAMLVRLLFATFLGMIIGYEREVAKRPAGLRTHMLVCMGSAIFTMISFLGFSGGEPAQVAGYVVMGIGFIGAGTVLQTRNKVVGLTTAASLWITASIGMLVGTGYYLLAFITSILVFLILKMKKFNKNL